MIPASLNYAHIMNGKDTLYLLANIKFQQQKRTQAVCICRAPSSIISTVCPPTPPYALCYIMIQLVIGCAVLLQNTYSAKYYNRAKNNKKNIVSHLLLNLFITIMHFSLWLRVCGAHLAHPEYTPLKPCYSLCLYLHSYYF